MRPPDMSVSEVLDRLRRRADRLESSAGLLRAEIESLIRRLAPLQVADGQVLDFGFARMFEAGQIAAPRPAVAYQMLCESFCIAFDTGQPAVPEVLLWQTSLVADGDDGRAGRAALNIDVVAKPAGAWLLLEVPVAWERLRATPEFDLCIQLRSSSASRLGVNLYCVDRAGQGQQTPYHGFSSFDEIQVETVPINISDDLIASADPAQPPRILLHLSDVTRGRIEILSLQAVTRQPEWN